MESRFGPDLHVVNRSHTDGELKGLLAWIKENNIGEVKLGRDKLYFVNRDDAILYKLTWC